MAVERVLESGVDSLTSNVCGALRLQYGELTHLTQGEQVRDRGLRASILVGAIGVQSIPTAAGRVSHLV